jgi:hypothetical protein
MSLYRVSEQDERDIPHNIHVPIPNVYSVELYGENIVNGERRIWKEAVSYLLQRHLEEVKTVCNSVWFRTGNTSNINLKALTAT